MALKTIFMEQSDTIVFRQSQQHKNCTSNSIVVMHTPKTSSEDQESQVTQNFMAQSCNLLKYVALFNG